MTNEEIIESIKTNISRLANSYYKLLELKATERFVIISSKVLLVLVSCFIVSLMLFLASIALAIYLGDLLDNKMLGYLLTASCYLVLVLLLILLRKKIFYPLLRNYITRELYD